MEGNDWRNTCRWNTSAERERGMLWGVRLSWSLTQTTPWGDMRNWIMKPRDEVAGWDWAQVPSVMMHRWRKKRHKDPTAETKCSVGSCGWAWRCCRPNYRDDEHSSERELTSWWSRRPAFWVGRRCAGRPRWGSRRRFPQTGWCTARPHTWPSVFPERTGKNRRGTVFHVAVAKCHLGVDEEVRIFFLKE